MQEALHQDAVQRLLRAADERSAALYPTDSRFGLGADDLLLRGVRFFVARLCGQAVGCGGFAPTSQTEGGAAAHVRGRRTAGARHRPGFVAGH